MRFEVFLAAGVVLIGLGIGLAEHERRNGKPAGEAPKAVEPESTPRSRLSALDDAALKNVEAPSTSEASGSVKEGQEKKVTDWAAARNTAPKAEGATAVAKGSFNVRQLVAQGDSVLALAELPNRKQVLVELDGTELRVLQVDRSAVIAVAGAQGQWFWAERGSVFSVPVGGGPLTGVVSFKQARITALSASDDGVVVSLMPQGADVLAEDAWGALAKVSTDGSRTVTVLATKLVRPAESASGGGKTYYLAGYPTGLFEASVPEPLAARADAPLSVDGERVVYRVPEGDSGRVMSRSNGEEKQLLAAAEALSAREGQLLAGKGTEVSWVGKDGAVGRRLAVPGQVQALALSKGGAFAGVRLDSGESVLYRLDGGGKPFER